MSGENGPQYICGQVKPRSPCTSTQSDQGFLVGLQNHFIHRDSYIAIFISYPISSRDTHISPRADMSRGWYGVGYENCHIIIYLSYIFSFWEVCLIDIVCGVKGKTAECSECGDMFFFARAKKPYHPRDLEIWVFCPCKKAVSPTWPIFTPFALHNSDMCLKAMLVSHMQNEHIF